MPVINKDIFLCSLRLLSHRGPDGEGVWQDGSHAIFGHRRLSILDISSNASQPMSYMGRFHCVFNGELYNFLEIKQELESLGHSLVTKSDTEVVIAAYAQWGPKVLNRFNGMWALAIWDSNEKKLFLSRDRMGKKPLFYFYDGKRFAFASEQKALLPLLKEVKPSKDFALLCANSYSYESTESSLFESIKRFPAAHFGYFTDGKLTKFRYWSALDTQQIYPKDYDDQVDFLRELILDSCKIRLRSDVPVGTALSGGIDSSLVAGSAAEVLKLGNLKRISSTNQSAYVASFPNTLIDEATQAKKIADHLGIHFNKIDINPATAVSNLENWAYLFEEIHEVNWMPHISLYKEMSKHGIKVSLDGHGGDELFCGYEDSVLYAIFSASPNFLKMKMVWETYKNTHLDKNHFQSLGLVQLIKFYMRGKAKNYFNDMNNDSLNEHLYDLSFVTILPTLLRNYDRYSMISGVEIRMPLLDYRIVEFAFSLPWTSKVRGGLTKSILRDAAIPFIPSDILKNKKKIGFAPPILDWMRHPLREYLLDEVNSLSFISSDLVDSSELAISIRNIVLGKSHVFPYEVEQVWKKFNIYLWEKEFIQKKVWRKSEFNLQ